jgi:putative peptidoglycan lipid II flippase
MSGSGSSTAEPSSTAIRNILRAAFVVGLATFIVKVIGFGRELMVAGEFGRGDTLDAFLIAYAVPSFVTNLFSSALGAAVIPTFIDVRFRAPEAAQRLLCSVTLVYLVGVLVLSVFVYACSPLLFRLFASGFHPGKVAMAERLFVILLPTMLLGGLAALWSAVLNSAERFWLMALAPSLVSIVTVPVLILAPGAWRIDALALGVLLGTLVQAVVLGAAVRKNGLHLYPAWYGYTPELRNVAVQSVPVVLATVLMSGTTLTDQVMAASLDSGSVAALSYADKLVSLALGLVVTTLGTAALPYFSQLAARRDWTALRATLQYFVRRTFVFTVPGVLFIVATSECLVRWAFQRGAFGAADTRLVAHVLTCLVIQIPFNVAGLLTVRIVSVLNGNRFLLLGNVISFGLNVVLNYVLMRTAGVAGIALSTSCVYAVAFCYLTIVATRLTERVRRETLPATLAPSESGA